MGFQRTHLRHWFVKCGIDGALTGEYDGLDVSKPYRSMHEALFMARRLDVENPECGPHKVECLDVPIQRADDG